MTSIKAKDFQEVATRRLDYLRELIEEHVAKKGEKEAECQQCCLRNRVNDLQAAINGTTDEDMK